MTESIRKRGLRPFDVNKHARFKTAADNGFAFPEPSYPVNRTGDLIPLQLPGTNLGMGGNGPDPTATGVFAQFAADGVGDCGGGVADCGFTHDVQRDGRAGRSDSDLAGPVEDMTVFSRA